MSCPFTPMYTRLTRDHQPDSLKSHIGLDADHEAQALHHNGSSGQAQPYQNAGLAFPQQSYHTTNASEGYYAIHPSQPGVVYGPFSCREAEYDYYRQLYGAEPFHSRPKMMYHQDTRIKDANTESGGGVCAGLFAGICCLEICLIF